MALTALSNCENGINGSGSSLKYNLSNDATVCTSSFSDMSS